MLATPLPQFFFRLDYMVKGYQPSYPLLINKLDRGQPPPPKHFRIELSLRHTTEDRRLLR